MQLITATLSSTTFSCIIGSTSPNEMWVNLKERFSFVTKASIFQLKTELQNIKKGTNLVSEYLQKIKDARDHLAIAGVAFEDDDIIILALKGLTAEYNTFRRVIRGMENGIFIKEFRSQLLAEEETINYNCGSSFGGGSNQSNSSNNQSYFSGNQNSYNNENYNGGYNGGYKGNNYRGKGRGKFNYNSVSRFNTPTNNPGILGAPKLYQSNSPDHPSEILTCQICSKNDMLQLIVFKGIQVSIGHISNSLGILLFNAIIKGILHIKGGLMHLLLVQCMLIITF
ncbi:hypothetical protein D8674_009802 [Pyrus ussuriensis x Pyrus communis]|uniref:Uncharacterized protein n=1 Tax=Pyrus ussuriensis x Pyrus communis TaxID=2448454 RepID=A0A5N5FCG8_9ROSA|nr:hypothetical protein D8674_009802 [Pyrus ussuriensis x Pyrus communis]